MPRPTTTVPRELRTISALLRSLAVAFGRLAPASAIAISSSGHSKARAETPARRKPRLTLEWRRALKLQGRYMGTMRGLPPKQQARVKKIRAEKGIRAAIKAARRMAG
jgi:hypothetical protein